MVQGLLVVLVVQVSLTKLRVRLNQDKQIVTMDVDQNLGYR